MQAMQLRRLGEPLIPTELPDPEPGPGQVRVRVTACGVCRTDLHLVEGELPDPKLPIIPGHEIVGRIDRLVSGVDALHIGMRVGIPWLGFTCGVCAYCVRARRTCAIARGSPATRATAAMRRMSWPTHASCFRLPGECGDIATAPLPSRTRICDRSIMRRIDPGHRLSSVIDLTRDERPEGDSCMTKPIPDKAEVALEYPDKLYIGTFERSSRFDAHLDKTGISLALHRGGDAESRRAIRMHLHYGLFAEILQELAKTASAMSEDDTDHRAALREAAKALHQSLTEEPSRAGPRIDKTEHHSPKHHEADISNMTPEQEVLLLHVLE